MGALHEGHLSLVRVQAGKSRDGGERFCQSHPVWPKEILAGTRVLSHDKRLSECGADYLFYPSVQEMYPKDY